MSNSLKDIVEKLLLFSDTSGNLTHGYRTRECIIELQELTDWEPFTGGMNIEDIQIGETYYVRPIEGLKSIFHHKPVKVLSVTDIQVQVELEEKARRYDSGTKLTFFPEDLSDTKEDK